MWRILTSVGRLGDAREAAGRDDAGASLDAALLQPRPPDRAAERRRDDPESQLVQGAAARDADVRR
jgi:hypothetical protein